MLAKRSSSAIVIIILCLALLFTGGWFYTVGLAVILAIAAWEFAGIFEKGGYAPAKLMMAAGTFCIALTGKSSNPLHTQSVFSLVLIVIIIYHVVAYPKKHETAALDMAIGLAGIFFIAYMGIFLVRLRFLPDGLFWVIQCIAPAGLSDVGAFFIGSTFGKHKIARELSPNKTIEGFFGGVFTSLVIGYGIGLLLASYNAQFSETRGMLIGLIIGIICPLGDFAKSILKRQFGLKNTGTLIPGHGGVLDRIDTWLVAGITSYFLILYFFI